MCTYEIFTDSGCDLPAELREKWNVKMVSLNLRFRGTERADSVGEGIEELYQALRNGETASTSAINPDSWEKAMEPTLQSGKDVLVLAFSSGLSTTYQSAVIAAGDLAEKYPQRRIRVVDTRSASLGQGLLVYYACRKRDEGMELDALADWAEDAKTHLCHWFTVDDLMYLKRGGRVSAATALVGTMLNIKPVLHMDNEGHLISMVKARGRKAAISTLVSKMQELGGGWDNRTVFICHADCRDDAERLAALAKEKCGVEEAFIGNLGAVIGSHAGPGTLSLFFMGKEK